MSKVVELAGEGLLPTGLPCLVWRDREGLSLNKMKLQRASGQGSSKYVSKLTLQRMVVLKTGLFFSFLF